MYAWLEYGGLIRRGASYAMSRPAGAGRIRVAASVDGSTSFNSCAARTRTAQSLSVKPVVNNGVASAAPTVAAALSAAARAIYVVSASPRRYASVNTDTAFGGFNSARAAAAAARMTGSGSESLPVRIATASGGR